MGNLGLSPRKEKPKSCFLGERPGGRGGPHPADLRILSRLGAGTSLQAGGTPKTVMSSPKFGEHGKIHTHPPSFSPAKAREPNCVFSPQTRNNLGQGLGCAFGRGATRTPRARPSKEGLGMRGCKGWVGGWGTCLRSPPGSGRVEKSPPRRCISG